MKKNTPWQWGERPTRRPHKRSGKARYNRTFKLTLVADLIDGGAFTDVFPEYRGRKLVFSNRESTEISAEVELYLRGRGLLK